jgi:type IV pilus assembly protein PilB
VGSAQKQRSKLGELLVASGEISTDQLATALEEQRNWGGLLGLTLIRLGFVDEHSVMRTLAEQLQLPVVQIKGKRVNAEVLELVSAEVANKHRCLPLLVNGVGSEKALYLGIEDPSDPNVLAEIAQHVGMKIQPVLVAQTEMAEAIQRHYHGAEFGDGAVTSTSQQPQTPAATGSSTPEPTADSAAARQTKASAGASEPALSDLCRLDLTMGKSQPFAAASPLSEGAAVRKARGPSDPMLQALAQLLVEKGVITRDELVERLRTVLKPKSDS